MFVESVEKLWFGDRVLFEQVCFEQFVGVLLQVQCFEEILFVDDIVGDEEFFEFGGRSWRVVFMGWLVNENGLLQQFQFGFGVVKYYL